jgi:hypothetical protein
MGFLLCVHTVSVHGLAVRPPVKHVSLSLSRAAHRCAATCGDWSPGVRVK